MKIAWAAPHIVLPAKAGIHGARARGRVRSTFTPRPSSPFIPLPLPTNTLLSLTANTLSTHPFISTEAEKSAPARACLNYHTE